MSATVSPVRGPHPARALHALSALAVAAALSACGGGGGGGTDTDTGGNIDQPQSNDPPVTVDPLNSGAGVFHFKVDANLANDEQLAAATGGTPLAIWNPGSGSGVLTAGLKLMFFGKADGCQGASNGPVNAGVDDDLSAAAAASRVSASSAALRRWSPSGQTAGCSLVSRSLSGPSMAYLEPDASNGGLALYTQTGARTDGSVGLMAPFDAGGQNGGGANAHITGTFANFRQAWREATAITPWLGLKSNTTDASARILSIQGVGDVDLGADVTSEVLQAKQQISVAFINTACMAEGSSSDKPCQLSYLLNTAIYRYGVDDWGNVSWFQSGKVWFDPAQGGVPIIELPMKASGTVITDGASGLPLSQSKGAATQHQTFSNLTFDARISFSQLQNALRIVSAKKAATTPSQVTDAMLARDWGAGWNDRTAWKLLSASVAQEIYNKQGERRVQIGGSLKQLYVAPQG